MTRGLPLTNSFKETAAIAECRAAGIIAFEERHNEKEYTISALLRRSKAFCSALKSGTPSSRRTTSFVL